MHDKTLKQAIQALRVGARYRIPIELRKATDSRGLSQPLASIIDDAVQTGLLRLLELGLSKTDARRLNIIGQTAAKTLVRQEQRYAPGFVERTDDDGDLEEIPVWDLFDLSDLYRRNSSAEIEWRTRNLQTRIQRGIMNEFANASPKNFDFLMKYLVGRRKRRYTREQRNRAGSIIAKLRRQYQKRLRENAPLFQALGDMEIILPAFASRLTNTVGAEKPHRRKAPKTSEDISAN